MRAQHKGGEQGWSRPANCGEPEAGVGWRRRARPALASGSGDDERQGEDALGAVNLGSDEGAARRERCSELLGGVARRGCKPVQGVVVGLDREW
jgi:hypothetical protein